MTASTTLPVFRPIGNLERYSLTRQNAEVYYNVIVGPRIRLNSSATLTAMPKAHDQWVRLLSGPLNMLIAEHPVLSAVVGDHLSAKPLFLQLPTIDISRVVRVLPSIRSRQEIAQVMEDEHNIKFSLVDHSIPLWQLIIVPVAEDDTFYALYKFQHVISDGRSAMVLTEQLVDHLNAVDLTLDYPLIVPSPQKPLPLTIEERVDCGVSARTLLYEVTHNLLLPGFIKKALETKYWAGEIDSSLSVPNHSQVGYLQLTKAETTAVAQACKKHQVTINSFIYTAAIFAAQAVFLHPNGSTEALVYSTPVALRPWIPNPIPRTDHGSYTSEIMHEDIRVRLNSKFWEMTAEYQQQVTAGTQTPRGRQVLLEHFGLLAFLGKKDGDWERFMRDQVAKDQHGRKASIKNSNIGRGWDQPKEQLPSLAFVTQDAVFSQSAGVTGAALTMNASTANGTLSILTSWQKPGFQSRERGDLFVAETKRIMLTVAADAQKTFVFEDFVKA